MIWCVGAWQHCFIYWSVIQRPQPTKVGLLASMLMMYIHLSTGGPAGGLSQYFFWTVELKCHKKATWICCLSWLNLEREVLGISFALDYLVFIIKHLSIKFYKATSRLPICIHLEQCLWSPAWIPRFQTQFNWRWSVFAGLTTEGLYRVSGNKTDQDNIQKQFDQGKTRLCKAKPRKYTLAT